MVQLTYYPSRETSEGTQAWQPAPDDVHTLRWGLCIALADPSPPLVREIVTDSNVEMTWKTFAGAYGDIYLALLRMRCEQEGGDPDDPAAVAHTLTVHLHRGIGLLAGRTDLTGITDLIALAISQPLPSNAPGVIE